MKKSELKEIIREEIQTLIEKDFNSLGELQLNFLIDQLVNAMEHIEDENEFVNHINQEILIKKPILKKIYKAYWKLSPQKRLKWAIQDWKKWLNQYGLREGVINEMSDDENPQYLFSTIPTSLVLKFALKKEDGVYRAKQELANRGFDKKGKWIGFEAAGKLWGIK